jgi:hypothetical protein
MQTRAKAPRAGRVRRYRVLIAAVVGALGIAVPWSMLGAGAAVSNPGAVNLNFTAGSLSTALGSFGPITGTLNGGTVDASGNLTFPAASASFPSFDVNVTDPIPLTVTISPVATSDFTGNLDPDTGVMTLSGGLTVNLAIPTLGLTACPLGPLTLNLSTENPGGVAYDDATGSVTLSDNTFSVPEIPAGQAGCGGLESLINTQLGLPSTPGSSTLTLSGTFSRVLLGSTTTGAPATTTTLAPTTTTVAPTTTTAAPTTTTIPVTTTTGATTTTIPVTTTTGATTTTIPVTTTTGATTTTIPVTTTTVGPTTTTTVGQTTTTTTVPAECKPGWGHGDKNHEHCGPPGLANKPAAQKSGKKGAALAATFRAR